MGEGEWGHVSLREYIEEQFKFRDQALTEARVNIDRRLNDMNRLREQIETERGQFISRRELLAVLAVVVAILFGIAGFLKSNQLSSTDVSNQIQREAPWVQDRPDILARLNKLENQVNLNSNRIDRIEALDTFFCKTRQPKLPGCL